MRLTCLKDNLSKGLAVVSRAVATRTTLPITQNVVLATDQGRLKLSSTNLEIAISTWIGAEIQEEGSGAIVYLRQEGRGIGLKCKIQAYALQDIGYDTLDANLALGLPADAREYSIAAKMLKDVGVHAVRLMTNNPLKVEGLVQNGVNVIKRKPHITGVSSVNQHYLSTKSERMGHILDI